jgi:uncharacterized damage-inducible protein DinB
MNHHDVSLLVDYNYWARDRMLEAVGRLDAEQYARDLGNSFRSVRDTVVHLYSAEWVWYSRWRGQSPMTPVAADAFPDLSALRAAWTDMEGKIRTLVAGLGEDGMARVIPYTLMNGTAGSSIFWQMLQHVVNHGSYHRGQVTTMLRQLGAAPPKSMDLIAFYRERST